MGAFEDRVERLRPTIGDEEADELLNGSVLRQTAKSATDRAAKLEQALLTRTFAARGVKIKPTAVRFPDNFDPTDDAAVDAFLLEAGLVEPPKDEVPPEEQEAHESISSTVAGGGTVNQGALTAEIVAAWPADKLRNFQDKYPEEFEAMLVEGSDWKGVGLDL